MLSIFFWLPRSLLLLCVVMIALAALFFDDNVPLSKTRTLGDYPLPAAAAQQLKDAGWRKLADATYRHEKAGWALSRHLNEDSIFIRSL